MSHHHHSAGPDANDGRNFYILISILCVIGFIMLWGHIHSRHSTIELPEIIVAAPISMPSEPASPEIQSDSPAVPEPTPEVLDTITVFRPGIPMRHHHRQTHKGRHHYPHHRHHRAAANPHHSLAELFFLGTARGAGLIQ